MKAACGNTSDSITIIAVGPQPDLDIDSNNDGVIDPENIDSEDVYEAGGPGHVLIAKTTSTIRINAPFTSGVLSVNIDSPYSLWIPGDTIWDLPEESPPQTMTVTTVGGAGRTYPLELDEPIQHCTITLKYTPVGGPILTDTVSVTIVRPVSTAPKNNEMSLIQPFYNFRSDPNDLETDVLATLGYQIKVFNSQPLWGGAWTGGHNDLTFQELAAAGNKGILMIQCHGSDSGAIGIRWDDSVQDLLNWVGVPDVESLPIGMSIIDHDEQDWQGNEQPGYLLIINTSWVGNNWTAGATNRAMVFLLACHSDSFFGTISGSEVFGYNWCCTADDHEHDMQLLIGRMNSGNFRPAGIAFEAGTQGGVGFTSRTELCGANSGPLNFKRWLDGHYWSTLSPRPFATADVSGIGPTGNKVGHVGISLDTQVDNASQHPANQMLLKVSGTGGFSKGPYFAQPSSGVGAEYLLAPGQSIGLEVVGNEVVSDDATDEVTLAQPPSWTKSN